MKLHDAVVTGRFCGLETVEECVVNVARHSMSLFLYSELAEKLNAIYTEYDLWKAGALEIDFDAIDAENDKAYKEMEASNYG